MYIIKAIFGDILVEILAKPIMIILIVYRLYYFICPILRFSHFSYKCFVRRVDPN